MKFPSEAEAASSVNESHVIVECENSSAASVKPKKLTFATLKSWITGFFPTALKNPNALTFSGLATGTYDGSAAKTINIPAPTIPAALPNPERLTIRYPLKDDFEYDYDGSDKVRVEVVAPDDLPAALPNPHALRFFGAAAATYIGDEAVGVYIPFPVAAPTPTGVLVKAPAAVSVRNTSLQRIEAQLLPAFVAQGAVLFQLSEGEAIALYPDGTFRAKKAGACKVYVIPTLGTRAYKEVSITVRAPLVRLTGSGAPRITGSGKALIL